MFTKVDLQKTPEYWLEAIQNELYQQVVDYMEKEKINQTELANKLGVSKGYISQILKGQFNYTLKKLIELSLAIGKVPNIQFESISDFTHKEKLSTDFYMVVYPSDSINHRYSFNATNTYDQTPGSWHRRKLMERKYGIAKHRLIKQDSFQEKSLVNF
jgi:transcriptional regulator with XRE-family HTH domain